MCGIAGYIGVKNTQEKQATVNKMCSIMSHRGPDARQSEQTGSVCFGHARLAIIDLDESANQPMWNNDKTILLALNGEIYNFKSLKKELQHYSFKTKSDTEVLLACYEKWGISFLSRIEGMFSIAVFDNRTNKTYLIRDRFGKKPLYYIENDDSIWFGSEIRALTKSGCAAARINRNVLGYYLQYQSVHYPETIIENIKQIEPGCFLQIENGKPQTVNYYQKEENETVIEDFSSKKLHNLFYESVQKRLVSDVPLAVLLSAGIDSNLILAAASKVAKVDTFTIGFNEEQFDESKLAGKSAKFYGAKHHVTKLSENDFLHAVTQTLKAMDHPSGDGPNTYVVSEQIKKAGFTVALSGLGGDELFYGYPHYANYQRFSQNTLFKSLPNALFQMGSRVASSNRTIKLNALKKHLNNPISSMAVFRSNYDEELLRKLFDLPYTDFDIATPKLDALNAISITEMNYYMHDTLLRDADQMSMAHSVELRNPFLDQNLVHYIRNVKDKKMVPAKNLLYCTFSDDLPSFILNKKKTGFTFPWDRWMRGALNSFCEQQIAFLETTKLFKKGSILNVWNSFMDHSKIHTWSRVWPLVCLSFYIKENELEF